MVFEIALTEVLNLTPAQALSPKPLSGSSESGHEVGHIFQLDGVRKVPLPLGG